MGWRKVTIFTAVFLLLVSYFWPRETFHDGFVRGKRILVTGASSGIGEQLAYQYAERGASVFITARREALLQKVIGRCKAVGASTAKFGYKTHDMSDLTGTKSVIEAAVAKMGGLDQIILNHAYIPYYNPWSESQKDFDLLKEVLDINMRSFAQLAIQAVPFLKYTGGSIGVVSSLADTGTMASVLDESSTRYKKAKSFGDMKGEYISPTSSKDCAYAIMRGTTMREREIFFPSNLLFTFLLKSRDIFPIISDRMIGSRLAALLEVGYYIGRKRG